MRIDLLTDLDGVTEEEIWSGRQEGPYGAHTVFYLGKEVFIKNKRAAGRGKDLLDLKLFREPPEK